MRILMHTIEFCARSILWSHGIEERSEWLKDPILRGYWFPDVFEDTNGCPVILPQIYPDIWQGEEMA
jgi:hypothetical protein